jgi:hypothetical protein
VQYYPEARGKCCVAAGWHVGTLFDPELVSVPLYDRVATETDIRNFLSNIETRRIEAEFRRHSGEVVYLDNVAIKAGPTQIIPEPSAWVLTMIALVALCTARQRFLLL